MADDERDFHFDVSGEAQAVVQAVNLYGGVHNHIHQEAAVPAPRQLTQAPDYYTNNTDELAELTRIIRPGEDYQHVRVAAIRGEPGSGRTAFVSHWGENNSAHYPDGLFYLSATGFTDASAMLETLLVTAGLRPDRIPPTLPGRIAMWRSWTAGKRLLAVVDDVVRPLDVSALLPGPGPSAVLAVPVGDLAGVRGQVSLTPLNPDQSLALLRRRLDNLVDKELGAAERLVEVCRGSAAALNVAADLLIQSGDSIAQLVRQLDRRGPLTHLKMGAVFDTAYDRLPEKAQRCYRALGAHPGTQPIVGEAALAAAVGLDPDDMYDVMRTLSRASLVARIGDDRYRLTNLLSVHAAAKAASGDGEELLAAFLRHYRDYGLRCAETITPDRGWLAGITPLTGTDATSAARAWLAEEEPNLAASVRVADDRTAVELCLALWPLYIRGQHADRMVEIFQIGVAKAAALGEDELLSVLRTQLGFACRQQQDWPNAAAAFDAAQRTMSATAAQTAVEGLGLMYREQGDVARAEVVLHKNVALAEELGATPRRRAMADFHLATVLPPDKALPMLAAAHTFFTNEAENLVKIDRWRGTKLNQRGDHADAVPILTSAAELAGQIKLFREQGLIMLELARADPANAVAHLRAALKIFTVSGVVQDIVTVRARMAELGVDPDKQP